MKNLVGPQVRAVRRRQGVDLTQEQLAARLQALGVDIDRTAISKIETGARPVTDIEVRALCRALDVKVVFLFGEEQAASEATKNPT
tara:strand:- start:74 stop:331 length:258 start_codon:yes stop_codon:yes gene_type:complete